MHRRCLSIIFLCCFVILLSGCAGSMMSKQSARDFSEQLYIDARLAFAIKHPLDWKRLQVPVSSPEYRDDTVLWQIADAQNQSQLFGEMQIKSSPSDPDRNLPDLLSSFLTEEQELIESQVEELEHPVGPALKLLGSDRELGRLAIALKGQARDFVISLTSPSSSFEALLPIFQDIVDSFVEILPSENTKQG